jgi:homoserine trans-succinylase
MLTSKVEIQETVRILEISNTVLSTIFDCFARNRALLATYTVRKQKHMEVLENVEAKNGSIDSSSGSDGCDG